jgi:hypothetical protein
LARRKLAVKSWECLELKEMDNKEFSKQLAVSSWQL